MSPKFYAFLWILTALVAAGIAIAGSFTMVTLVWFGFIAFGLVFTGMMCVLPGTVSHPPVKRQASEKVKAPVRQTEAKPSRMPSTAAPATMGLRVN